MANMIHSYPDGCMQTVKMLVENRDILLNKWYKHSNGMVFMLNTKGYYHIWKFEKIETNAGIFKGMVHYRLTDKNTLAEIEYKILETKEAAIEFYNSFNAE